MKRRRARSLALGLAALLATQGALSGTARTARAQGRAGGLTEEEETFQAAEAAFKDGREAEAERLYEKVTAMNPRRADAWVKRAVIRSEGHRYAEAVALLEKANETLPDDTQISAQLGIALLRTGRVERAVGLLERAVEKQPDLYQAELALCTHYVKAGDGRRGAQACAAYFQARPAEAAAADAQVRAYSGTAYLLEKRYAEAEHDLALALANAPRDAATLAGLGAVYTATGRYKEGIAAYGKLGEAADHKPAVAFDRATCFLHENQLVGAERSARAYLAARPDDARGLLLLGDVARARRAYDEALAAWAEARRLAAAANDGTNERVEAEVSLREGEVALARGRWPEAAAALSRAERRRPDDPAVLIGLTRAFVAMHKPRADRLALAERLARPDVAAAPGAALAAALAFESAGDGDRAQKAFAAALATEPTNGRAKAGLARVLGRAAIAAVHKKDLAGAEALLGRAAELAPDSVVIARDRGVVLLLEGRPAEAEAALAPARARVPGDVTVNRLLGRAAAAEHHTQEAIARLEGAAQAARSARAPELADVLAELGPLYLDAGRLDAAVATLSSAASASPSTRGGGDALSRNLAVARARRGLWRISRGVEPQGALDDLSRASQARAALSPKELAAIACAHALATLKVGRPAVALDLLARAQREGGCTLRAPFDRVGPELLTAYAAYRDGSPGRAEQAARTFQRLVAKAQGPLVETLQDLARAAWEVDGVALYQRGDRRRAEAALRTASRLPARGEHRELDHNLAVLDMDAGHEDAAERVFEALGPRPPEALENLGIVRDRAGESRKALDLYRKALERGARGPHLREWIDAKERVLSRPPAPGAPAPSGGPR